MVEGDREPEKPEGKVTKRCAEERRNTLSDPFRAWRFTEQTKGSMAPVGER